MNEVGLVIAMSECPSGNCPIPSQFLGRLLYNGPFNPQNSGPAGHYENFTVTVPDFFGPGQYLLNVYDVSLVGVSLFLLITP